MSANATASGVNARYDLSDRGSALAREVREDTSKACTVGSIGGQDLQRGPEGRSGLRFGCTRSQPREHRKRFSLRRSAQIHRIQVAERAEWNPKVARLLEQSLETRLRHADDLKGIAAQQNSSANDTRIAAEATLPRRVAENHDGSRGVVGNQRSPERRSNAEHREEVFGDSIASCRNAAESRADGAIRRQIRDYRTRAQRVVVGAGESVDVPDAIHPVDRVERIRIADIERTKHVRVEDREHARIDPDAKSDRDHDGESERRRAPKRSKGVPHVGHELFDRADAAHIARILFDEAHVAEFDPSAAHGLVGIDASVSVFARLHLEMEVELFCELELRPLPRQQYLDPQPECARVHLTPVASLGRPRPRSGSTALILPRAACGPRE